MKLFFTKMQGAGNDYLFVDCRKTRTSLAVSALRIVRYCPKENYGIIR